MQSFTSETIWNQKDTDDTVELYVNYVRKLSVFSCYQMCSKWICINAHITLTAVHILLNLIVFINSE